MKAVQTNFDVPLLCETVALNDTDRMVTLSTTTPSAPVRRRVPPPVPEAAPAYDNLSTARLER